MNDGLQKLVNQVISAIYQNDEKIVFRYGHGDFLEMHAIGDCCSKSWIEAVDIIPGAVGSEIISIFNESLESVNDHPDYDCLAFYKTIIRTRKGDIIIDYRNSSNGYYGGWLEEHPFDPRNIPKLLASIDPEKMLKELI